ncbi:hypothetical protein K458DRAFT_426547 [Lentithecium fluviatile CBS 122367]|uniref:Zinc finger PHD-type domain-containing protein n=1 Tax=Lentithecium fluviatile CBS 122367 TaxID=1168545 RepID=A0A6G1JM08_9PLEO|nr:hypothetical protein K458DRAFT_426547 [Lentithecium fluviatile CBS 122367]
MVARKRGRDEMEAEEPSQEPSMLQRLRNMWQFANLAQYLSFFKGALRIDEDFSIEDLETECLKPQPSEKLSSIGLALLKHVSSHKGLTPEIFDEYARRQFVAKSPTRNPFGTDETPNKFDAFDVYTKIRVLQQLSVWTLNNPNTIREKLNPTEAEQLDWRFPAFGEDSKERKLFVLDDFRLYRLTAPPPPTPPPKAKSKAKSRKSKSTRASKRRKQSSPEPEEVHEDEDTSEVPVAEEDEDDGFGGQKWECLCVTLEEYQNYMASIRKSKNADEKALYSRLEEEILPELAKVAEEQARKEARKLKELEVLQKLAMAKRSSRISAKLEKQKEIEEAEEAQRRREAELAMAKAEQDKQRHLEEAHESRRQTREQRIREREAAKILQEETLRKLEEQEEKIAAAESRGSERHLKARMKKAQQALQKLTKEEFWMFDCEKCSMSGACLNDGSHQLQCERCEVWQHSKCHGITPEVAEKEEFVFICASCRRKEQAEHEPKLPPLKLRFNPTTQSTHDASEPNGAVPLGPARPLEAVRIPVQRPPIPKSPPRPMQPAPSLMSGPSLSPQGQALGPPGIQRSEAAYGSPLTHMNGSSPPRAYPSAAMGNSFSTSTPPRYQNPGASATPFNNTNTSFSRQNGSPFGAPRPFQPTYTPSYVNSFSRPTSSTGLNGNAGPFHSPIKHSPAPSPRPSNGVPNAYNFNSPHSSFPPTSVQEAVLSPTKHSSPPPPPAQHMSSPAPAPLQLAPSPRQMPAQMLPDPIPAPLKHDGARPISSHEMSERVVLPPIKALSPNAPPQDLSPPTKKASPTPDRPLFAPMNGNGLGGPQ